MAAARIVARDFGLAPDWLNSVVGAQIHARFPPAIRDDLTWKRYAGLDVGFAGRRTLIALKLFAAADRARGSVHHQDLVALRPTDIELGEAERWVLTQDAAPKYPEIVREVIADVRRRAE